jgi:hypothetical protein
MKKQLFNFLSLFLIILPSSTLFSQTTIVIPLSQGTGADAYLASGSPNSNFGTHQSLGGNTWSCTGSLCTSRGLFKFDLSSIPAGATITSASLELFADLNWSTSPTTGGPNNAGYLSRVTSSWVENTVTWGSQPTTTTANQVLVAGSSSTAQNYTINVTALTQDMLTNGNFGFMLTMQDELNYYKSLMFASSENVVTARCPKLTVSYTTNSVITTSITLCQGNGEDAYLASGSSSSNFGTHGSLGGNIWTCTGNPCISRGLFKFDLTTIPSGAVVTSASLALFADLNWSTSPTTGGPNNAGYLNRVTSSWSEGAVTWNTQPTSTTLNQVVIPGSSSTSQNYTVNVTSLTQDMLTNINYGFMLKMQDEVNYYKSLMFASSDNANSATKCPVLTISYINQTGINDIVNNAVLSVYPNPFENELTFTCSDYIENVIIVDALGKEFINQNIGSNSIVLKDQLSAGIYFASVYGKNSKLLAVKKIIKL